jgi:hypothetical protein
MTIRRPILFAIALVLFTGCAPGAPSTPPSPRDPSGSGPAGAPSTGDPARKTITIGVTGAFTAFSVADTGNTASGGISLQELWLQSLVTSAHDTPAPEARIAAELPSIEKGSM